MRLVWVEVKQFMTFLHLNNLMFYGKQHDPFKVLVTVIDFVSGRQVDFIVSATGFAITSGCYATQNLHGIFDIRLFPI
jgi:hypothetical protein